MNTADIFAHATTTAGHAHATTTGNDAHALTAAYEHPGYGPREAGRDLWFTRQRHGVGYWDRRLPRPLGQALTDAAEALKECYVEVWRGWIYVVDSAPN